MCPRGICIFLVASAIFSMSCGSTPMQRNTSDPMEQKANRPMERKTSTVLEKWKHGKTVTVDLQDVSFSTAIEEIQKKTGVRIKGKANAAQITLNLKDVPFWRAVAELSAAAKTPFFTRPWNGLDLPETVVAFDTSLPPCSKFQIIGPFHIGVGISGTKEEPLVFVRASSLITEGSYLNRGVRRIYLIEADGRIELRRTTIEGDLAPVQSHWVIPKEKLKKGVNLVGEMECEVYFDSHEIRIPVEKREGTEFKELGGIKVVTEIKKGEKKSDVLFTISWPCGLNDEETKKATDDFSRAQKGVSRDEEDAIMDWFDSKTPKLRLLQLQRVDLIDKKGSRLSDLGTFANSFLDIQGSITFQNDAMPNEIRLRLCERKAGIAVFEFKDIFSQQ